MSEYVPTTAEVRGYYAFGQINPADPNCQVGAEFDRWLESVQRQAREVAWDEGARTGYRMYEDRPADVLRRNPYRREGQR